MIRFVSFSRKVDRKSTLCVRSLRLLSTTCYLDTKKDIRERWSRRTEKLLKRTAQLVDGDGQDRKKKGKSSYFTSGGFAAAFVAGDSGPSDGSQRRARQLSAVLSNHVMGLISSGEVCPQLTELGLDIIKVSIVPDMSVINILWASSGTRKDEEIIQLLPSCATRLRAALLNLRIMGRLPPIQFVMDETNARLNKVEELLKVADMGPDFEPTPLGADMKTTLSHRHTVSEHRVYGLEEFIGVPGPGGSVEMIKQDAEHPRKIRCETVTEPDKITTSSHVDRDYNSVDLRPENSSEHKFSKLSHSLAPAESGSDDDDIQYCCSDDKTSHVYGLDRTKLWQQVATAKRKASYRHFMPAEGATGSVTSVDKSAISSNFSVAQVRNVLKGNRKKNDRMFRNVDRILSSHYHNAND